MFVQAYLYAAIELLESYPGGEPFSKFSKKFFSLHKKFGSKDRKHITHICYCYFRTGRSLKMVPVPDRLAIGLFLCNKDIHPVLHHLMPGWDKYACSDLATRLQVITEHYQFKVKEIFSMENKLSPRVDLEKLSVSILEQPCTYLRIRPGKNKEVVDKLNKANISYQATGNTIQLPPATKLESVIDINKEVVVQDLSSQKVLDPLVNTGNGFGTAWDCCAASGGKSILLRDLFPHIALTVSDIRESILVNLQKRFEEASIMSYKYFVTDLSAPGFKMKPQFDLIICDAPCTGSGTWGRTPEQLFFFDEHKIEHYSSLQKKILSNCIKGLTSGGMLHYITCSVFKEENEDIVMYAQQALGLRLVEEGYIEGYEHKADTLYTALFKL